MKKKAALLLAILVLGAMMAACGQSGTSEPAPTATPEATEEPAEPTATPEAEPANQDNNAENEPVDETDEAFDAMMAAHDEEVIQKLMNTGMSREEAEDALRESREQTAAEEKELEERRQQQHEEFLKQLEEDTKADIERSDAELMEKYGLTTEQWQSMSASERYQWAYEHQQE